MSNLISFTNRDVDSLREELIALIPKLTDKWTDFSESDPGMVLVELMSYLSDLNSFYIDKMALEHYLETAVEYKNIRKLLTQVVAKPYLASAPVVELKASLKDKLGVSVKIPAYTVFNSSKDISYSTFRDEFIPQGSLYSVFDVIQGIPTLVSLPANGVSRIIKTRYSDVSRQYVTFKTGSLEWTCVDNIFYSDPEIPSFEFRESKNNMFEICLCENFRDFISESSKDTAELRFFCTKNLAGNIKAGDISTISKLYGQDTVIEVFITNEYSSSGGSPRETIEEIKARVPKTVKTTSLAITLEDYKNIISSIPEVANSSVLDWNVPGEYVLQPYVVAAFIVPKSFDRRDPSSSIDLVSLERVINSEFFDKKSVGVVLKIYPPEYVPFDVDITVKSSVSSIDSAKMKQAIRDFVIELFEPSSLVFGQEIHISDVALKLSSEFTSQIRGISYNSGCTEVVKPKLNQFVYLRNINIEIVV